MTPGVQLAAGGDALGQQVRGDNEHTSASMCTNMQRVSHADTHIQSHVHTRVLIFTYTHARTPKDSLASYTHAAVRYTC